MKNEDVRRGTKQTKQDGHLAEPACACICTGCCRCCAAASTHGLTSVLAAEGRACAAVQGHINTAAGGRLNAPAGARGHLQETCRRFRLPHAASAAMSSAVGAALNSRSSPASCCAAPGAAVTAAMLAESAASRTEMLTVLRPGPDTARSRAAAKAASGTPSSRVRGLLMLPGLRIARRSRQQERQNRVMHRCQGAVLPRTLS